MNMDDSCDCGALNPRISLVQARNEIEETYPPSRERSLVLTKIDEALLWYNQMDAVGNGTDRE